MLLFSSKLKSFIVNLFKSRSTFRTAWQSFRFEKFVIVLPYFPIRWTACMSLSVILMPTLFTILLTTFSRSSSLTDWRMTTNSRYSLLDYWALLSYIGNIELNIISPCQLNVLIINDWRFLQQKAPTPCA